MIRLRYKIGIRLRLGIRIKMRKGKVPRQYERIIRL